MKNISLITILSLAVSLIGCTTNEQKQNTISISGAFALYPLVVQWSEAYQKEHPEIRFNISAGGAGKGMADALSQTVDLGMFSREIVQEEINKGVWWVGLTIDAVLPTMSADHPEIELIQQHGMTQKDFIDIFIEGTKSNWDEVIEGCEKQKITVYVRSDACGAAGTWAKYLGGNRENLKGIGIYGDPGLADAVAKDPTGVGFNNTIYIYDLKTGEKRKGIEVIPIDLNDDGIISADEKVYESFDKILDAIAKGVYPSPPARELYFVSKGKPTKKAVIDFIEWTLTDGQKFIKEAGYVPLDTAIIQSYLQKLK